MRAGLPKREPEMLKTFYENRVYETLMEKNKGKPPFILHDGPPFSNGDIHLGHALNKILKDIIVRYKNMSGFYAPYVPGWDNHGMPIETAITKKNKLDRKKMSIPEFRNACFAFASEYVDRQREQFKRLGVIGDWDNPYLTMAPSFEAEEVRVFGKMYEKGYIYKGHKPVYWCPTDETALAEAEIEYADVPCKAIYVKFKIKNDNGILDDIRTDENISILIWTTTPWTLPGNLAVCLGPDIEYAACRVDREIFIIAAELAETVFQKAGITNYEILKKLPGRSFEHMVAQHPFYDRESLIILGGHVTVDTGTGCVHTAPGHGVDDFNVCKNYPQITMVMPVDAHGVMTEEALQYEGNYYSKTNDLIIGDLKQNDALLAVEDIVHSYPHCWRCKNPVIFRATEQWFASVDAMKDTAVKACDNIAWIPEWGKDRMIAMLVERSDWCISRQRHWGLPIPVFYCDSCHKPVCTPETIDIVAGLFGSKGSNSWHEMETGEILPEGFACPHCKVTAGDSGATFSKGSDSLDCWFDSGSTHAGVMSSGKFPSLSFPADLYLEGGDQYRGWFQSSMLTSIAVNGVAPYRRIITNGWTVDGEGYAMHKSTGNVVAPEEIIRDYGADILRLWVASTDYRTDVRMSKEIAKQLSDIYLKIRNTARFILGNLNSYDPDDPVSFDDMPELDRWALSRLNKLIESVRSSYEKYEYHTIYHAIHNFCTIDMSNFYLDIIKDRLYCDKAQSISRRSAQTTIYTILDALVRLLTPVLAFTAEEIWALMPHRNGAEKQSVLYNPMPEPNIGYSLTQEQTAMWESILSLRSDVYKALEIARINKVIGKSLEAEVTMHFNDTAAAAFEKIAENDYKALFIVSDVHINTGTDKMFDKAEIHAGSEFPGVSVAVGASKKPKCVRCWKHDTDVGINENHPELCPRCVDVVGNH